MLDQTTKKEYHKCTDTGVYNLCTSSQTSMDSSSHVSRKLFQLPPTIFFQLVS